MIGATNRASAAGRRWAPALAGVGLVVLGVAACGGSTGNSATPAATIASPAAPGSSPSPSASQAAFPGVVGTAAAVSGSSLEVQNPTSGQVTVTFTASTPITETVTATAKDVTVGSCVTVVGKPSAAGSATGPVTATTVTISAPVKGNCVGGAGFGGGFGGFGRGGGGAGGSATPRPSFSARPRPTGSRGAFGNGAFGGANGKVTSVSATGFVVQARGRTAGAAGTAGTNISVTVLINSASKYLQTVTAKPSALKVGQCITALGTPNSIGAVAARSIRVSQPGPSGCVSGFGGRGGFGRPSTNA
jgi:hypothetical protein